MLIETKGGFDFTGADCCAWMREVGFRATYVEHLDGPDSMAVGIKESAGTAPSGPGKIARHRWRSREESGWI